MKQAGCKIIEKGSNGFKMNLIFDDFIISLSALNVVAIAIESTDIINQRLISTGILTTWYQNLCRMKRSLGQLPANPIIHYLQDRKELNQ